MNRFPAALAAAFLASSAPLPAPAERSSAFDWHGALAPGAHLVVQGVVGDIRAAGVAGRTARVHARLSSASGDPDAVHVHVETAPDRVVVCAVYSGDESSGCSSARAGAERHDDVRVDFTVDVPPGVAFAARTVNGGIVARGLDAGVDAATVTDSVEISTAGFARATSVNGSIDATLGAKTWPDTLRFATVNGNVHVTLPRTAAFTLRARTTNGTIRGDGFALPAAAGGWVGRSVDATIGGGGRRLELETVNGDVRASAA